MSEVTRVFAIISIMYMIQRHVSRIYELISMICGHIIVKAENWKLLQGMRIPCLVDKKGVMDFAVRFCDGLVCRKFSGRIVYVFIFYC